MMRQEAATFVDADLRGARFVRSALAGAVIRGDDVRGLDIDAPWLKGGVLMVNGVDVMLAEPRATAWSAEDEAPVLHGLNVILNEQWEHLRFALRDLDALADRS